MTRRMVTASFEMGPQLLSPAADVTSGVMWRAPSDSMLSLAGMSIGKTDPCPVARHVCPMSLIAWRPLAHR